MAIKDIFLPLVGEPDAAAIAALDKCAAAAGGLGARVSAMAVEANIPIRPTVTVSSELDNTAAVEAVRRRVGRAGPAERVQFCQHPRWRSQRANADPARRGGYSREFAACARLKDLSLVGMKTDDSRSERIVERLIFESGRPILMCPQEFAGHLPVSFDKS